jgi:hypothetical protein
MVSVPKTENVARRITAQRRRCATLGSMKLIRMLLIALALTSAVAPTAKADDPLPPCMPCDVK